MLPSFFCSAPAAPGLIEELWQFAKSAYLNNPLPSLFKERLFVHLSRFCRVRYCIIRHVGFLIGEGRPAGDASVLPQTVEQAMTLLRRPIPDEAVLGQIFVRLENDAERAQLPLPETPAEGDLFDALTVMFLAPTQSERARLAVCIAVGAKDFELLAAFLAFVRTAHYWTETHPDLAYEPDIVACMNSHPELARLLMSTKDADAVSAERRRLRTERALHESELKYRALFGSIDTGFCIIELIFDDTGAPIDYVFLEANSAFEVQTGLVNVLGKRIRALVPDQEEFWFKAFGRIARTGQAERFEHRADALDRWFSVYAFRFDDPDRDRVVVLFENVTERKLRELRTEFLDAIGKDLVRLSSSDEIMQAVGAKIGAFLNVSGCNLGDVDEKRDEVTVRHGWTADNVPGLKQTFRLREYLTEEFARASRAGELFIVDDTSRDARADAENHARLRIGAFVVIPLFRDGRWTAFFSVTNITPRNWRSDEIELLTEISERLFSRIERARAEAALRESETRFAQFAEASSGALWIRDAKTLVMEYVSPAIARIYGIAPDAFLGDVKLWAAAILPEDRDIALEHIERARQGEAVVHEFRIQRATDQAFRWIRDIDFPLLDEHGRVQRIGGIAEDISETKLALQHQGVLLAELQHRVRNIMAMIRSITARTGERAESVPEYASLMTGRLLALARVQALLTRAANISVGIRTIVHDEISVQAHDDQYDLDGPDITLSAKAAEILTLVVHELTTNALKYGALSVSDGEVRVQWAAFEQRGQSWIGLDWTEAGAPGQPDVAVGKPRRRGFGSELIERRVSYELGGRGHIVIEPGGARCRLEFPLKEGGGSILETTGPQRATVFGGALDMTGEPELSGYRILVVEDDYYLATDAARALQGAGAEVMGPCPTEEAARAELDGQHPHAVVVDVNLGQGPSFKLAETLAEHGIPFVFTTGYDPEVIPKQFDHVERLQKPVHLRQIVGAISRLLSRAA